MPTTAELDVGDQEMVTELVKSGRYASAEDVVREAMRLVRWREAKLSELDRELAKGLDDIKAGRVVSLDDAFDPLIAKYDALADAAE